MEIMDTKNEIDMEYERMAGEARYSMQQDYIADGRAEEAQQLGRCCMNDDCGGCD
jgi:hypothetical protein